MSSVTVEILGKSDCCLCDRAKEVLARVRADHPFDLREVDITTSAELMARWGEEIPVVFVAGRKAFKYTVDEAELRKKLARAGQEGA